MVFVVLNYAGIDVFLISLFLASHCCGISRVGPCLCIYNIYIREFSKIRGALLCGPFDKDPTTSINKKCIYIYICSRVPGPHTPPPPPMVYPPPPFPVPGPRPRAAPVPGGQPERTHANQSEGGRWRMIPASASSQERRTASEQGQGAPFARRKEQHHTLYGNEHVTMTLLLTSGSNHTISL